MYSNFRDDHKGVALKNLVWKAARATKMSEFNNAMEEIKTIKKEAYDWLCERPAVKWSRSHFNTHCKCDMLLNNICECFNSNIIDARDKPIITMLEKFRVNLMERIHNKKNKMRKYDGLLCPAIQAFVETNKRDSVNWVPKWNEDQKFELVGLYGEQVKVDIGERTCGCRKWELTGIPCAHAIASLNYLAEEPKKFVSHHYLRETFLKTYDNLLNLVNGKDMWAETGLTPVLPPNYTRQPGRPKRNRSKKKDENKQNPHKLGKQGIKMSCSLCGSTDHNKRRCPKGSGSKNATNPTVPRKKLPVRGKGTVNVQTTSNVIGETTAMMWHGKKVFRRNATMKPS